jgi:hypothetical protein
MADLQQQQTKGNGSDAAAMFWQWFVNNEHRFRGLGKTDSDQALVFLEELIGQMKPFNPWLKALAGPYSGKRYELIITADGDVALFCKVEELVARAPQLSNWKFTAHKPALGFEGIGVNMYGKKFSTDTTCFYPIIREEYPDEVAIVLTHVDYNEAEDDQFQAGGMIYLENGLGEENTATKIDHYETAGLPDPGSGIEVIPITKLPDYLNWREKEFVEKYESVHAQRPEESFTLLEAEDTDGKMMMVTIDMGFKDWALRPAFPWYLQVDISYDGNDGSGLPTGEQLDELHHLEEQIIQLLTANGSAWYVGHRTYDNLRNTFFYASEYKNSSQLIHHFVESVQSPHRILFSIRKDKYWQNMEMYFNVNAEE